MEYSRKTHAPNILTFINLLRATYKNKTICAPNKINYKVYALQINTECSNHKL